MKIFSDDNKEFDTVEECQRYEANLSMRNALDNNFSLAEIKLADKHKTCYVGVICSDESIRHLVLEGYIIEVCGARVSFDCYNPMRVEENYTVSTPAENKLNTIKQSLIHSCDLNKSFIRLDSVFIINVDAFRDKDYTIPKVEDLSRLFFGF